MFRTMVELTCQQMGSKGGGTRGALAPPILDLRTWTLHMDNRLLRSLSRQPPNHIFVLLPLMSSVYVNQLIAC